MISNGEDHENLVRRETRTGRVEGVPEIRLHLADDACLLWTRTEADLERDEVPLPFWAFAWAGGQVLARYLLDRPEAVLGRSVLDFAAGSGLVAIAAAKAGALKVAAADIDPYSGAACRLNADLNEVEIAWTCTDLVGGSVGEDVLLAGDVFFDGEMAARLTPWFDTLARAGVEILIGDPHRAYLPIDRVTCVATYKLPVMAGLEDADEKLAGVFRWNARGA